ncbi:MAG: DNA replication/repair protein RecF [Chloroflexi bacterium]|nr:DNA replication/repair protein RecF [Chloroflexota bacterium]
MYLTHISLTNFRNYTRLELDLPARIHVLLGDNAQGKTNLLEAICYLSTTKSPLASADRQLINWSAYEEVIPYARAKVAYIRRGEEHTIETILVLERENGTSGPPTRFRRQIQVDGLPHRAIDVVGRLHTVLFMPQDITLVAGSPGDRRRYLDITLCQVDPVYCRNLSRYNRVLAQRNALLREGRAAEDQLAYWDEQLTHLGGLILERRLWATAQLDIKARTAHERLTGAQERLDITYESNLVEAPIKEAERRLLQEALAQPQVEGLVEWFQRALKAARPEERRRGITLIGPHRDDIRFHIDGVDAIVYGSRGQQRTVALALKLGEMALMHQETGEMPVLLLDDVLSELDERRSRHVLEAALAAEQVLMTTTDLKDYRPEFIARAMTWRVVAGRIEPLDLG